jgi:serine/threonine protein kinase
MADNFLIGQTLRQRYKIVAKLGKGGGFGETYLAEDLDIPEIPKPRRVVKRLKPSIQHQEVERLFQLEAETLNKLGRHDRIPTLYAYFEDEGEFYLVQELIEGRELGKEMTRRWGESETLAFLEEILEILAFVHQSGVIHRDIKPANIMRRDRDRQLVLIDFGAVKEVSNIILDSQGIASKTIAIGTPGYIPSEQAQGRPQFSSDIYAAGMTAIQALTGTIPTQIPESDRGELDWQKYAPPLSQKLTDILTKMVRSRSHERYANATLALQALRRGELEPVSAILSWTLLKIVIHFINLCPDVGLSLFKTAIGGFIDYLKQSDRSLNYELQKAAMRASIEAEYRLALEYRHQLARAFPTFLQYSPFHSQQKREGVRWVNQKIARLSEIRSKYNPVEQTSRLFPVVEQTSRLFPVVELISYIENLAEKIASQLRTLPPAEDIPKKKEQFLAAAIDTEDNNPEYAEKLSQENGGFLDLVCVEFAKEIKQNQLVAQTFELGLLASLNSQLIDSPFVFSDIENALLDSSLDLTELKRQQERASTVINSPNLQIDIPLAPEADEPTIYEDGTGIETSIPLETPRDRVPIYSNFYIERPPIESECYQTIMNPGALIRIKAPRQMGKTSLLTRILERSRQQGDRTVFLNLQLADSESLETLDGFLQWFCAIISDELGLEERIAEYWHGVLNSKRKCTKYLSLYLLSEVGKPLVLGLDEVDKIFQYPKIAPDFFALLRAWHEQGRSDRVWQNLRLVIAHSQEVYIPLNVNQSPFNVGLPIELREFSASEVENLVRKHQLNWSEDKIQILMKMVGGHPYLVRVALYQIVGGKMTLEELLELAPTEEGPLADHLRRHLYNLQENPELLTAIKKVIAADSPVQIGAKEGFKLHSMGLVKFQGNLVAPRCELYRLYFSDRL